MYKSWYVIPVLSGFLPTQPNKKKNQKTNMLIGYSSRVFEKGGLDVLRQGLMAVCGMQFGTT